MNSKLLIRFVHGCLLVLMSLSIAGCCCCMKESPPTLTVTGDEPLGSPPCEPESQVGVFGSPVVLELPEEPNAEGQYQWYRYQGESFVALTNSNRIIEVSSPSLVIQRFAMEDVAYYARMPKGGKPKFPCNFVYNLMGTTNGAPPVWGAPVPGGGGSAVYSYCGTVPCPGTYAAYVTYSKGWRPAGAAGPTVARDGNPATRPSTKVRYGTAPLVTPPTCGCNGEVIVLNPKQNQRYTFTIYFPPGVSPSNPHPLELVNFLP